MLHAAAYKHVPLMEQHNEIEALRTNVLGTLHAARVAAAVGAARSVLISTDKAVNPTSVMGASKRLAEQVVQAVAAQASGTRYVSVRFGNVLGSSGSVVPRFAEQVARGGPGHRHAPRHRALLHDHSRGRATGAAGRVDGHQRSDLRA